ncbi:MAG: 3-phosphoshikimate 1-carboxyvinyltransferase [Acidimicrobiales bacterium]
MAAPSDPLPDPLPVEPLTGPLAATVVIPGSKSLTNRALVCAALGDGPSVLTGVLDSDDTRVMLDGLRALGVQIDDADDRVTVWGRRGRFDGGARTVDAGLSGTTSRFLLAVAALCPGPVTVDGGAPLRARPMADGVAALEALGCEVASDGGRLPITVARPEDEFTGSITVRGEVSSQFLSGLLLAAPCLPDGLEITVDGPLQSVPYVEMTIAVMRAFGARVEQSDDLRWFAVEPTGYQHTAYAIEPDASAASYVLAAAALCGGTVTVPGLGSDSVQGDVRFAEVLRTYGATVTVTSDSVTVTGDRLLGGDVDMGDISDTAQTLAAIAPFAEAPTTIHGIGFIRGKETDRIAAVVTELGKLGVVASEQPDGLHVEPGDVSPATVDTYDDHRMAMSFAVLGLRAPGVAIADPGCVSKTFPGFWNTLEDMRRQSEGHGS